MSITLINGSPGTSLPVTDRAFQYGDGVFETVRISNSSPILWNLHVDRLLAGCRHLQIPVDTALLQQELDSLLAASATEGILKIIISRGSGGRGYRPPENVTPLRILQFHPLPRSLDLDRSRGISTLLCTHPVSRNRSLARFKHLCRLDQVLASMELTDSYPEGIMLTDNGQVIEGTRSNLFLVIDRQLVTPSLEEAGVRGVMRAYLLQRFSAAGADIRERAVNLKELRSASELFFCNSIFGVWPVTELALADATVNYVIGAYTSDACGYVNDAFFNQS